MHADASEPELAAERLLATLRSNANPANVEGMARFGIATAGTLGVPAPIIWRAETEAIRAVGREPLKRHEVARLLWESGVHEARVAAAKVDVPSLVTREQMEAWALEIDSWDVCDQLCMKCWHGSPAAPEVALEWAARPEEFVKRVAFVLMAMFGWKHKDLAVEAYAPMLDLCVRESRDERTYVKKAINWAIRQIGKRDAETNTLAVAAAERILAEHGDYPSARWIARDSLRELQGDAVRTRIGLAGKGRAER